MAGPVEPDRSVESSGRGLSGIHAQAQGARGLLRPGPNDRLRNERTRDPAPSELGCDPHSPEVESIGSLEDPGHPDGSPGPTPRDPDRRPSRAGPRACDATPVRLGSRLLPRERASERRRVRLEGGEPDPAQVAPVVRADPTDTERSRESPTGRAERLRAARRPIPRRRPGAGSDRHHARSCGRAGRALRGRRRRRAPTSPCRGPRTR